MLMRQFLYGILIFIVLLLFFGVIFPWTQKRPVVLTKWNRSDGIRNGEEIYFLSNYSLYLPGKVIIPMFVVTNTRYLFRDVSLYRLSGGGHDKLERLWSFGPDISGKMVDLQSCRYARSGNKLYFSWNGGWNKTQKKGIRPVLEYDLDSSEARLIKDMSQLNEFPVDLNYHPANKVARSKLWGRAGLLPLSKWDLPSPLEYSSRYPEFLKKIIMNQKADRNFRSAAFAELDARGEARILRKILAKFEKDDNNIERRIYSTKWKLLIRMSATLRADSPPDIFSAAFDNDAETLKGFLDAGADPNSSDDAGNTLLMYAVLGEAPDTMTLLFEAGADPKQKNYSGIFPWLYAALNPLRHRFLKLWGK